MCTFISNKIKTDIVGLKILPEHIIIGVGGFLEIYNKHIKTITTRQNIFDGRKIYGIVPNSSNTKLIVYGNWYLKILKFNEIDGSIEELHSRKTNDWILTTKWVDNDSGIAVLSMHNVLTTFDDTLQNEKIFICDEKCILYSAFICNSTSEELIVLSGTVFSEILVWCPGKYGGKVCQKLQGHKGVIFSISHFGSYICSTSDDRSSILWSFEKKSFTKEDDLLIKQKCIVHGHSSRIFRCLMLKDSFLTGGENGLINRWNFNGELIRRWEMHQNGPIWALDCEENSNIIVSGGGDCGVLLFPLEQRNEEHNFGLDDEVPKNIVMMKSGNLVVITENGSLFYGNPSNLKCLVKLDDLKSYNLIQVSECRNMVALCGFRGEIYIYNEIGNSLQFILKHIVHSKSRIYAVIWLDSNILMTSEENGILTLWFLTKNLQRVANFILPTSKERWMTAACLIGNAKIAIGDRKGNLYIFKLGSSKPIHTLRKAHSHLGVTFLSKHNENLISLGRNGILNCFDNDLNLLSEDKISFTWLSRFVDTFLLAFSGNDFIIWDYKKRRLIFQYNCGGGHRSWDFHTKFVYIKDKKINVIDVDLEKFGTIDILQGFHPREVNCLVAIRNKQETILISGSEDTTLRISKYFYSNFSAVNVFKSHLSSIRSLCIYKVATDEYLMFSGGGRAQIICWSLNLNGMICSQLYSYYEKIERCESEMRIMDLCVGEINGKITVCAACSDGYIRLFEFNGKALTFTRRLFYKMCCIIKIKFLIINGIELLITMSTDGCLVFWHVENMTEISEKYSIKIHQSGINSYSHKTIDNKLFILTGGDDNAIVLNAFQIQSNNDQVDIDLLAEFYECEMHCAQITGTFIYDNYFLTTSIDQKLVVFRWNFIADRFDCKSISVYNSVISDIHGMECFQNEDDIDVILYGKGIEFVNVNLNK